MERDSQNFPTVLSRLQNSMRSRAAATGNIQNEAMKYSSKFPNPRYVT
jgi:hypothetical protein